MLLSEIDGRNSLSREELVFLASAAYLSGHPDTSLEAWEPAHEQALLEDDRGDAAAAAAVAIQRALLEHRLKQGFAPSVRIGLHVAEATKERSDWSGVGIHAASRIGRWPRLKRSW